jgi:hypothetical protein
MTKRLSLLLLTAACGSSTSLPPGLHETAAVDTNDTCACIAMGVDYTNMMGTTNVVGLPSGKIGKTDLLHGSASGDPVVRASGDKVFVVNRFGYDSITELELSSGDVWTLVAQWSTGQGTNPQDIAVDGDTAYVATEAMPAIEIFDLSKAPSPTMTDMIDLSSLQSDGNPDAQSIWLGKDGNLYVTLDLLDSSFTPTGVGMVAVIDPKTKTVTKQLSLNFKDPYGPLTPVGDGSKLVVPTEDDFSGATGCLESIDVGGQKVDSCVVNNSSLGGTIAGFALDSSDKAWLAVTAFGTGGAETGKLIGVKQDGTIDSAPVSGTAEVVTDVGTCGTTLLYADQSTGVLHAYDTSKSAEGPAIQLALPPGNQNDIVCIHR